jgi:hypothetical protein
MSCKTEVHGCTLHGCSQTLTVPVIGPLSACIQSMLATACSALQTPAPCLSALGPSLLSWEHLLGACWEAHHVLPWLLPAFSCCCANQEIELLLLMSCQKHRDGKRQLHLLPVVARAVVSRPSAVAKALASAFNGKTRHTVTAGGVHVSGSCQASQTHAPDLRTDRSFYKLSSKGFVRPQVYVHQFKPQAAAALHVIMVPHS